MIVVDTNILAYLYLPTKHTSQAEKLLLENPVWVAPYLWRSEFRNVLALYIRKNLITYEKALHIQTEAETLMKGNEFDIRSINVLSLVNSSECSAYDCEFVSLATNLQTKLYTMDKKVLKEFPNISYSLKDVIC